MRLSRSLAVLDGMQLSPGGSPRPSEDRPPSSFVEDPAGIERGKVRAGGKGRSPVSFLDQPVRSDGSGPPTHRPSSQNGGNPLPSWKRPLTP